MSGGIAEMKAPSARKGEDRQRDLAARAADSALGCLEIIDLDHRQQLGGRLRRITVETDIRVSGQRRRIVRSEIREAPAERRGVEGLDCRHIAYRQFEIA